MSFSNYTKPSIYADSKDLSIILVLSTTIWFVCLLGAILSFIMSWNNVFWRSSLICLIFFAFSVWLGNYITQLSILERIEKVE